MFRPSRRFPLACALVGALAAAACSGSTTGPSRAAGTLAPAATTGGVAPSSQGSASGQAPSGPSSGVPGSGPAGASTSESTTGPAPSATDTGSPEPQDTGGSPVSGDVPDNARFLTYTDAAQGFSIQYVEGWQVQPQPDGVVIRDKDSSETVKVVSGQTDANAYLTTTDLPALQALTGFKLAKQDTVSVKGHGKLLHLVYQAPAAPDPVTGKEVASTIDRYYVQGSGKLAVISLSTPDGVDNVDAFRAMIESFQWT